MLGQCMCLLASMLKVWETNGCDIGYGIFFGFLNN